MSLKLPNLFILGYAKCGTTSLFTYLARHPDLCGSIKKEPGYFFRKDFDLEKFDLNEYAQFFDWCEYEKFRFEASVNTVYGGRDLAVYFQENFSSPKSIILLREPVARLYSFYRLCTDNMYIPPETTFAAYLDEGERREAAGDDLREAPWRGYATRYVDKVREWLDVFGDDVYIGFFEDLKVDALRFCDDICAWLEVAPLSAYTHTLEVENKTISPRNEHLHRVARRINRWAEPTLRRYPAVKRAVRRVYQATNAADGETDGPTAAQRQWLREKFRPANEELRQELRARRPQLVLPAWLEPSAP